MDKKSVSKVVYDNLELSFSVLLETIVPFKVNAVCLINSVFHFLCTN